MAVVTVRCVGQVVQEIRATLETIEVAGPQGLLDVTLVPDAVRISDSVTGTVLVRAEI